MYYALLLLSVMVVVALASEDTPAQMQLFARGGPGIRDLVVMLPSDATLLDLREEIKRMTKEHEDLGIGINLNTEISFQGRYLDEHLDETALADLGMGAEAEIGYYHTPKRPEYVFEKIKLRSRGWKPKDAATIEREQQPKQWHFTKAEIRKAKAEGVRAGFDYGRRYVLWKEIGDPEPDELHPPYNIVHQKRLCNAFWSGVRDPKGKRAGEFAGECEV